MLEVSQKNIFLWGGVVKPHSRTQTWKTRECLWPVWHRRSYQ